MNAACQIISVSNAFLPMTLRDTLRTVSGDPPCPTPVMPASVSTSTTMLLCGNACGPLRSQLGGKTIRIFVTFVGDSRLAACASATGIRLHAGLRPRTHEPATSDPAAPTSDFVNVLRSMFIVVLPFGHRTKCICIPLGAPQPLEGEPCHELDEAWRSGGRACDPP